MCTATRVMLLLLVAMAAGQRLPDDSDAPERIVAVAPAAGRLCASGTNLCSRSSLPRSRPAEAAVTTIVSRCNRKCARGFHCQRHRVLCRRAPCPNRTRCVRIPLASTRSRARPCPRNMHWVEHPRMCFRSPCPRAGHCEPVREESSTLNDRRCPAGVCMPHELQSLAPYLQRGMPCKVDNLRLRCCIGRVCVLATPRTVIPPRSAAAAITPPLMGQPSASSSLPTWVVPVLVGGAVLGLLFVAWVVLAFVLVYQKRARDEGLRHRSMEGYCAVADDE